MPLTYTGRLVRPGGLEHPSLVDIAVGTSRQPRFAGQGQRWFSVLDHMLFCDELARRAGEANHVRIALLLHDAHEAITADVPTDVKTADFKAQQRILDVVIQDAFFPGGRAAYVGVWDRQETVRHYDRRALCAEAQVVGPPVEKQRILELFGITDDLVEDIQWLERCSFSSAYGNGLLGQPPYRSLQERHPAVLEYLKRMTEVM